LPARREDLVTSQLEGRALAVLHRLEASLGVYEVASGRELFRLPTAEFPHELCLGADRRHLYVTEYGLPAVDSEGEGGHTVAIFDLRARERVGTLSTGEYRRPHGIAADRGGRLFVTCEPQRALLIYRLEDESFLHVVDVGQELPHVVAVSPDGRTAFTANVGSATLSAIDVMMGVVLQHVKVLEWPEGMAFSPDGEVLYVVNRKSAAVSIVDPIKVTTIGRIDTGQGPVRIVITPDGKRIAFPLFHQDAVQIADTASRKVTHTIPIGKQPTGATLSDDGELLFVSCEHESRVYVIAMADGEVLTTVSTGKGPDALASLDLAEVG
jgi:YVTN family beta-propeller protein